MLGHGWVMVGTMLVNSWCNVGLLLAYGLVMVGAILDHGWCNVG